MIIDPFPMTKEPLHRFNTINPPRKMEMEQTDSLVIEADDLMRLRDKICSLYVDKNVIVAPCSSKLYLSREQKIIDVAGKTSPDWFYFATGVISIIYDTNNNVDLTLALFEKTSLRLLWCLKWADFINFEIATANFHTLNSKEDCSQHVGILYENKNVADLILNTLKLLSESMSQKNYISIDEVENNNKSSSGKNRLLKSLSLHGWRSKQNDNNNDTMFLKRKSSLRDSWRRKTIGWSSSKKNESPIVERYIDRRNRDVTVTGRCECNRPVIDQSINDSGTSGNQYDGGYQSSPELSKSSHDRNVSKITRLARALSFRHTKQNSTDKSDTETICKNTDNEITNEEKLGRTTIPESTESTKIKDLFKKRRLSRSQSLGGNLRKRDSQVSQISQYEEQLTRDPKQYQRPTKLIKQRSSTDTLLLRGRTITRVIETGHVARYARERRKWAKMLENSSLQSTDLCVTEL